MELICRRNCCAIESLSEHAHKFGHHAQTEHKLICREKEAFAHASCCQATLVSSCTVRAELGANRFLSIEGRRCANSEEHQRLPSFNVSAHDRLQAPPFLSPMRTFCERHVAETFSESLRGPGQASFDPHSSRNDRTCPRCERRSERGGFEKPARECCVDGAQALLAGSIYTRRGPCFAMGVLFRSSGGQRSSRRVLCLSWYRGRLVRRLCTARCTSACARSRREASDVASHVRHGAVARCVRGKRAHSSLDLLEAIAVRA